MKLKYIGDFPLSSVQKSFTPNSDEIHELSEEDGNYLLKTFPKIFEQISDKEKPKVENKEEVKTEQITEETTTKKTTKK